MFQVVQKPWKPILRLLSATKYVLVEIDKAKFQGVDRPCETIVYLMGIQKATWTMYDMFEVEKAMCHGVDRPCELNFYLLGI
jgi:hypothetical protein